MKILIVDDSVVFRMAIKQALESVAGVEIVGALSNGQLAVDFLKEGNEVDLVTLDLEMPVLDGIGSLKEIRKFNKEVSVVVFSSVTTKGAEKTIEALNCGADDFVTKESTGGASSIDRSLEMIKENLLPLIEALKNKKRRRIETKTVSQTPVVKKKVTVKPNLIVMASSTGGPEALRKVFGDLQKGNNAPILLVQHMPPVFTKKLAEVLTRICPGYEVVEAEAGMELKPSTCYIAPGDFHMVLTAENRIDLNQKEKVCYVRPAANCLFESVASHYKGRVLSIVLTGMGEDGADGVLKLAQAGSENFYQDEASSTVFGMPKAVKNTGVAHEVELLNVAELINMANSKV